MTAGIEDQVATNPQGVIADLYKQANLPSITQRLYGELAGKDVFIYGRVWTYLEGSLTFAATAFQALAFFVKDFALTLLALLPAVISSDARRFVSTHVAHMMQDLVAIPIGLVGFISPHAGNFLAKTAINVFASMFQDKEIAAAVKAANGVVHMISDEMDYMAALGRLGLQMMDLKNELLEIAGITEKDIPRTVDKRDRDGYIATLAATKNPDRTTAIGERAAEIAAEVAELGGQRPDGDFNDRMSDAFGLKMEKFELSELESKIADLDSTARDYESKKSDLESDKTTLEAKIKRHDAKVNPPAKGA